MKRFIAALLGCVILASLWNPAVAQASQPDRPYTYDEENQAVPSVNAYQVKEIVDVTSLGGVGFTSAQDLFVDAQDQVYVLDSGKGRVIWLDENFDLEWRGADVGGRREGNLLSGGNRKALYCGYE